MQALKIYRQRTGFISKSEFGGLALKRSHSKTRRPFSCQKKIHVVLMVRRQIWRNKILSYQDQIRINKRMKSLALTFRIKTHGTCYHLGNIQFICQSGSKDNFQNFLRSFCGAIARMITKIEKGTSSCLKKSFFLQRPFTRILVKRKFRLALKITQYLEIAQAGLITPRPVNTS